VQSFKFKLLSSTRTPVAVGAGVIFATVAVAATMTPLPDARANPSAVPLQIAQSNPCSPCAAKNPCNPCGAANPCNPCAAKNPCNPCNPCSAANPCNPCGAANPCNPCAAKNPCNPCNPCGAANPCNPCNPCAAKNPCNPCNPCAAANPCNPCNPCAAKNPCNPCNPCGAANPCNPCNPCGAGGDVAPLTPEEATAAYDGLLAELKETYAESGIAASKTYLLWPRYNTAPYVSDTHGGRYVNNYASPMANTYGDYENGEPVQVGAMLAKDSFTSSPNGVEAGPLFLMQKMPEGFNAASGDWKYTMILPGGKVFGETNGDNSDGMKFCYECHMAAAETDSQFFLPDEFRVK